MKTGNMIEINGAFGEGGGQIIRTSLALSMVTSRPFRISRIRANRKKPGLLRQHLTALNAAAEICNARIEGNVIGSSSVVFIPGETKAGDYAFKIGTAGSTTLVLQTLLPALMMANDESVIAIEGGTHNPFAPPCTFLQLAFAPLINRMGPTIDIRLERHGFHPAGGGRIVARIKPCRTMKPLQLLTRFAQIETSAIALLCRLPDAVGERELKVLGNMLEIPKERLMLEHVRNAPGMGNALMCMVSDGNVTEVFTGFGERGVPAEEVARKVAVEAKEYLTAGVPVGSHLADQLMIPMTLAGGGSFRTLAPTMHAHTNLEIIRKFFNIDASFSQESERAWLLKLESGETS